MPHDTGDGQIIIYEKICPCRRQLADQMCADKLYHDPDKRKRKTYHKCI